MYCRHCNVTTTFWKRLLVMLGQLYTDVSCPLPSTSVIERLRSTSDSFKTCKRISGGVCVCLNLAMSFQWQCRRSSVGHCWTPEHVESHGNPPQPIRTVALGSWMIHILTFWFKSFFKKKTEAFLSEQGENRKLQSMVRWCQMFIDRTLY